MAKFNLAELVVKFTGDVSGLKSSLDKAKQITGVAMIPIAKSVGTVVGSFVGLIGISAKLVSANNDLAKSLGISYAALQNLSLVAGEAGVNQGALGAAIGLMQRNLVSASEGVGGAAEALAKLGLNTQTLLNLSPDQQFSAIATEISKIEDPAQRTAIAMDIFGRSGRSLIGVFEDYGLKVAEATQFNEKFNLSMSQISVDSIDAADDAVGRIALAFQGIAGTVAEQLAPAVEDIANGFVDWLASADEIRNRFNAIANVVDRISSAVVMIGQAANPFSSFEESAKAANETERAYKARVQRREYDLITQKMNAAVSNNAARAGGGSSGLRNNIVSDNEDTPATKAIKKLKDETDKAAEAQKKLGEDIRDTFTDAAISIGKGTTAMDAFKNAGINALSKILDKMLDVGAQGAVGKGGGNFLSGIMGSIDSGIGSLFSGIFGGGIKKHAKGGVVNSTTLFPMSSGLGMAGEAGAEGILPLARGSDGKLGVSAQGMGGNVVQNINVSTGVAQTVRAEIQQMMPQLREMAVSSVRDAQTRGAM